MKWRVFSSYLQGENETEEHKLKILKRVLKHIIGILTDWKDFVFAEPHKNEANAHCTHLQCAQACTYPNFAKEPNLANLAAEQAGATLTSILVMTNWNNYDR